MQTTKGGVSPETKKAIAYLEKLAQADFWGAIRIKFESGRAVHILREEKSYPCKIDGVAEK